MVKQTDSTKFSISMDEVQEVPLTKVRVLKAYSDIFTGIEKFLGKPYKFQLKPDAKPARHVPRKVLLHFKDAFHAEIRNLECLGILKPVKEVTEWVNNFVIMEKKVPAYSKDGH